MSDTDENRFTPVSMANASPRIEYACEHCSGTAVTRDAWAEWKIADQAWALAEMFDFAFCHQCHRETHLTERPVST
jgi:hypothetical protein